MLNKLMILPSLNCPAHCGYCFGPHNSGAIMSDETLKDIIQWVNALNGRNKLEITFHGGEPLVAGDAFYQMALPLLQNGLKPREVRFGIQSNLWLLTEELCQLFKKYDVSLGTSLDGPESINDKQRGQGYYRRTMEGIQLARSHGMGVGCICTFTEKSASQAEDIFDFFLTNNLGFSIHAALSPLGHANGKWALAPETHGRLLIRILNRYLQDAEIIRISTLDAMIRSITTREGGTCTFGDCLGEYWAVDPEGWIYACQRFAGISPAKLGHVSDRPSRRDLSQAPFWQKLKERQERIEEECGDCPYLDICRGGCPYNVLAENGGGFSESLRDPHCPAYRRTFYEITDRALEEVFSEENMDIVVQKGAGEYGLMQQGNLLRIMRGGPHPQESARQAREVVAAAALGSSASLEIALNKLDHAGIITRPERAMRSLSSLQKCLDRQSQAGLLNAYLHVTYRCQLQCTHCYARAGQGYSPSMSVNEIASLVCQAAETGFKKAVLTGGEPTAHPQCEQLLDTLQALQENVRPLQTVLRTNLAGPLSCDLIKKLAFSTDQVVVSVDGNRESHDARRGVGSYDETVDNLRALLEADLEAEIRITGVLPARQQAGPEGTAVRSLGEELGIPTRLKSLLPLGRGKGMARQPNFYSSLDIEADRLLQSACPTATCGLGMNLYIGPEGRCYPCYALVAEGHYLGNALEEGLRSVLDRNDAYRQITVDSNAQCSHCELRYLCGGFCRAWGSSEDPNAPPADCRVLHNRAQRQLLTALQILDLERGQWQAAGLLNTKKM